MFKMAEKEKLLLTQTTPGVSAVVLGILQDAGLPHAGCRCPRCAAAYAGSRPIEPAACLAILDTRPPGPARVWLIDATPDIRFQLNLLAPVLGPHPARPGRLRQPDAIFLTHAHLGHVTGLAHLGPEAMSVEALPVYASAGLIALLQENRLWQPAVANLHLLALEAERPLPLAPDLTLTPLPVPHRDEWGVGTFAFSIQGPAASLLYLPDIDNWESWPAAQRWLSAANVALVDATFYSRDELGGRPPVAHPLVPDTLRFCTGLPGRLLLTHLNHTNPLLDERSPERVAVEVAGVEIAYFGQQISLS